MFIDMENIEENKLLQIGANLDREFVEKFREYCRAKDFKQKTLVRRLVECWLALDPINQEHIYRGRLSEVFPQKASGNAQDVVVRAKARAAKQKQKPTRKSSKAG